MPSVQTWVETLATSTGDGAALTTTGVATSILPAQAKFQLPPNYFDRSGKMLRITVAGRATTSASGSPSQTFAVRFGSTAVFSASFGNQATAITNATWQCVINLTCRSIGSGTTATIMGSGVFGIAYASGVMTFNAMPATAPVVGTGFDSTASQIVDFFATIATTGISSIQTHQYILESLN